MDHSSISFEITFWRPIYYINSGDKNLFLFHSPMDNEPEYLYKCKELNHLLLSTHSHLFKDAPQLVKTAY